MKRLAVTFGMVVALVGFMTVGSINVAQANSFLTGSFDFHVWTGTNVTTQADSADVPGSGNIANAKFTYTGPIDFVNNNPDGGSNTFADFGFTKSNISNFISATSGLTEDAFLATTMSTIGEKWNTFIQITGAAGAGAVTVTHDDGASLYQGSTTIFTNASPTSAVTDSGTLAAGNFTLDYVESNGSPSILEMTGNSVPEPSTLLLLGAGLAGLGLLRRKKA